MEFSMPIPKQKEISGLFSNKWVEFVNLFKCHRDPSGVSTTSFLLHYGAQFCSKISHEEFPRFVACLETLEFQCLFQIVLCFLRHLFFSHCQKGEAPIQDFYTELNLLSDLCSFDNDVRDGLIKNQLISTIHDKSVRDLLLTVDNLTARNILEICHIAQMQGITVTADLINIYLMEQQQKLFSDPVTKDKKDFGSAALSFPETHGTVISEININSLFRNDTQCTSDTRKDQSFKNCNTSIPYQSLSVADSSIFVNDKIPTSSMVFPLTNETVTNVIPLFEPLPDGIISFPSSHHQQEPVNNMGGTESEKRQSHPKTNVEESMHNISKNANNCSVNVRSCSNNDSNSSKSCTSNDIYCHDSGTIENENVVESNDDLLISMCVLDPENHQKRNDCTNENGGIHDVNEISEVRDVNEIAEIFISQQKVILKTSQIIGATGQSLDVYSCNLCAFTCTGRATIVQHAMQAHESEKCFVCTACNSKFSSKDQIYSHIRIKHLNIEEHKCQICDMLLISQAKLFEHLQGHAEPRTASCTFCKATFTTQKLLSKHLSNAHPNMSQWICRLCGDAFSVRKALSDHVSESHCEESLKIVVKKRKPKFVCGFCDISFEDKKSHESHKKKFHKNPKTRSFPCNQCDHVSNSKSNLASHERTHTGEKPYMCEICGKEFSQSSSLDKHARTHSEERPFKCRYCNFSSKTSSNRLIHERIHRNERPYICEQCGKCFRNIYDLKSHIETHNEYRIKPYVCHCGSAFHTKKKLKRHEVCHAGNKPYKCETCGAGFTRPENVRSHQKSQACQNRVLKLQ